MSGYRKPFTADEERKILHYIFRTNGFYKLRGFEFWKKLSSDELPNRTYQSLHERFRKYIINNIQNPNYGLSFEEQLKLRRIYEDTGRGKKVSKAALPLPVESTRTEVQGELARNFFEMSDSDESDGGNPSRKSNSCRNRGRIRTDGNPSNNILKNEEMKTTVEENTAPITNLSTSVVEIDSSSDSEIFDLKGKIDLNAENKGT